MLAALYALLASFTWGSSDFLAGMESRRATAWAVALITQIAALAGAVAVLAIAWPERPPMSVLIWPLLGGVSGAVGALAQYQALSIAKMSVVSPVLAATAIVPVTWGLLHGEQPSAVQIAGMALTVFGIVLITRSAADAPAHQARVARSGILLAVVAAVAYGLLVVSLDQGGNGDPYWAVAAMRLTSVVAIFVIARLWRLDTAPRRGSLPMLLFIGALLVAANVLFTTATTVGYLSVVTVLGWLSPAVVVFWSRTILRERLRRAQWLAAALILAGVVCLAFG